MYIEAVNRAMGEIRETQHHLAVAEAKGYLANDRSQEMDVAYEHCGRMLERLHQALSKWRGTTRTGTVVRETAAPYDPKHATSDWDAVEQISAEVTRDFS